MRVLDLGRGEYVQVHERMRALVEERTQGQIDDTLLFVEHPHVITAGRKARELGNVVAAGGVPVVRVERGGDVTYHGPGQLVCYPIFRLEEGERDAPGFLRRLEGWIIAAMARLGLSDGERRPPWSGVWCRGRKVASVGVSITARWVTWHGIATNVSTDLAYFERINPCGLEASVMTSLERLAGREIALDELKSALLAELEPALGRRATRELPAG